MDNFSSTSALSLTIYGQPPVKKNSLMPLMTKTKRLILVPRSSYQTWEKAAIKELVGQVAGHNSLPVGWRKDLPISYPINVALIFYVKDNLRRDIANLMHGPLDALTKAGVIADDRWSIVSSHDGTRVVVDKANPRVEISITRLS